MEEKDRPGTDIRHEEDTDSSSDRVYDLDSDSSVPTGDTAEEGEAVGDGDDHRPKRDISSLRSAKAGRRKSPPSRRK